MQAKCAPSSVGPGWTEGTAITTGSGGGGHACSCLGKASRSSEELPHCGAHCSQISTRSSICFGTTTISTLARRQPTQVIPYESRSSITLQHPSTRRPALQNTRGPGHSSNGQKPKLAHALAAKLYLSQPIYDASSAHSTLLPRLPSAVVRLQIEPFLATKHPSACLPPRMRLTGAIRLPIPLVGGCVEGRVFFSLASSIQPFVSLHSVALAFGPLTFVRAS